MSNTTFSGPVTSTNGFIGDLTGNVTGNISGSVANPTYTHTAVTANATATLTAAKVASGYITSTSAAVTTLTLPTGTLLGTALGAVKGTVFDLYIDNTAGASVVTMAVAVNGIKSALAAAEAGGSGLLTIPSGVTGQAQFTLMFSSATAYTFSRVA
jgi:hypothetical protein